ncbi:MAG: type I methionyl aminopeptidase [Verrucomicrobiae bacterium]|nr:type I methionyl aminopeptidase [Verrucomicrobiae bacterium]
MVFKPGPELEAMRNACRVAGLVLKEVSAAVKPGVTTKELDEYAAERIKFYGGKSAFYGYRVGKLKYPCYTCLSVNDQVVHGLANKRKLAFGDILSIDIGVVLDGFIGDNACTVPVGGCSLEAQRLLDVTENALYKGIEKAVAGNRVRDISQAIQQYVESHGCSVVREFVGHGIGRRMHEEPQVPNFFEPGMATSVLVPGLALAIEPMVNAGKSDVVSLRDGWTIVTRDGSLSAHFEHTVLITEGQPEILTWVLSSPSPLKA